MISDGLVSSPKFHLIKKMFTLNIRGYNNLVGLIQDPASMNYYFDFYVFISLLDYFVEEEFSGKMRLAGEDLLKSIIEEENPLFFEKEKDSQDLVIKTTHVDKFFTEKLNPLEKIVVVEYLHYKNYLRIGPNESILSPITLIELFNHWKKNESYLLGKITLEAYDFIEKKTVSQQRNVTLPFLPQQRFIAVEFNVGEKEAWAPFESFQSLLDADIVIFQPSLPEKWRLNSQIDGFPVFAGESRNEFRQYREHWERELRGACENGKIIFVFFQLPQIFYRIEINSIATPQINYSIIPIVTGRVIRANGKEMRLTENATFLKSYWDHFEQYSQYESYFEEKIENPLIITKSGARVIGALFQYAKGYIIFLPPLKGDIFYDPRIIVAVHPPLPIGQKGSWENGKSFTYSDLFRQLRLDLITIVQHLVNNTKEKLPSNKQQGDQSQEIIDVKNLDEKPSIDLYSPEVDLLNQVVANGEEGTLSELKYEIHTETPEEKAEFIRDIISLGNMALLERRKAYLIAGVKVVNGVPVITDPHLLDGATYQKIIRAYVDPMIEFELRVLNYEEKKVPAFVLLGRGDRLLSIKKQLNSKIEKDPQKKMLLRQGQSWVRDGDSKREIDHIEFKEISVKIAQRSLTK